MCEVTISALEHLFIMQGAELQIQESIGLDR